MKLLSFAGSLLLSLTLFTAAASAQTTFTNSSSIIINDKASASPYPSTIQVSGLSGTIAATPGSVQVTLKNFSHKFSDDVGIVLVGPTGATFLLQDGAGSETSSTSNITYTISDTGAMPLPDADPIVNGTTYKPSNYYSDEFPAPGPGMSYRSPGPDASGTDTFSSVFGGTNPNGEWKLYVADFSSGDAGDISGGWSLTITTAGGAASSAKFTNVDMNGDHQTDFSVTRQTNTSLNESSGAIFSNAKPRARSFRERVKQQNINISEGSSLPLYWYSSVNGTGAFSVVQFGTSGDFEVPEDYDGDGKDDITVWRQSSTDFQSSFYILQSKTGTVRIAQFGQSGDDPSVSGDYDNDGKADIAVFRCPISTVGQCYFYYRPSSQPNVDFRSVAFGFGVSGDYFAIPGDYDGDGKYDYCLQRNSGGNQAQFVLMKSGGGAVEYINWGHFDDEVVPGDYDGDGKSDFMVVRSVSGQLNWFLLTRTGGGTGASPIVWGLSNIDYEVPGDYDGDGMQDIAVWRPNPDPSQNYYYIRRSSDLTLRSFEWGQDGDYPVQNLYVH